MQRAAATCFVCCPRYVPSIDDRRPSGICTLIIAGVKVAIHVCVDSVDGRGRAVPPAALSIDHIDIFPYSIVLRANATKQAEARSDRTESGTNTGIMARTSHMP